MNNIYLQHHGILGQKWGVRRYQNEDGTLTEEGRKRYGTLESFNAEQIKKKKTLKKIAIGTASALAVAGAAYGIHKATTREYYDFNTGKTVRKFDPRVLESVNGLLENFETQKIKDFIDANKDTVSKKAKEKALKVGEKMVDAAIVSIGGIAVSKIAKKLESKDSDSQVSKDVNKVVSDTVTAGIKTLTNSNSNGKNNNSGNSKGGNVGKEISDRIGPPVGGRIDVNQAGVSEKWQALFKTPSGENRKDEQRTNIKTMRNAGYSIEQIQQYLDDVDAGIIKHLDDYSKVYIGTNFVIKKS